MLWLKESSFVLSFSFLMELIFLINKKIFLFCSSSDDVQRSIELLDRVLSEFDDVENANQVQNVSIDLSNTFFIGIEISDCE